MSGCSASCQSKVLETLRPLAGNFLSWGAEEEEEEEIPKEELYEPQVPPEEGGEESRDEMVENQIPEETPGERNGKSQSDPMRDPEILERIISSILEKRALQESHLESGKSSLHKKSGLQVVTTQEVPALQALTPEAVKKYAAQVRRWMGKGNAAIQRNSWDDEINARLDIEWQGSLQMYSLKRESRRKWRN
jgi:hypothetical protein